MLAAGIKASELSTSWSEQLILVCRGVKQPLWRQPPSPSISPAKRPAAAEHVSRSLWYPLPGKVTSTCTVRQAPGYDFGMCPVGRSGQQMMVAGSPQAPFYQPLYGQLFPMPLPMGVPQRNGQMGTPTFVYPQGPSPLMMQQPPPHWQHFMPVVPDQFGGPGELTCSLTATAGPPPPPPPRCRYDPADPCRLCSSNGVAARSHARRLLPARLPGRPFPSAHGRGPGLAPSHSPGQPLQFPRLSLVSQPERCSEPRSTSTPAPLLLSAPHRTWNTWDRH